MDNNNLALWQAEKEKQDPKDKTYAHILLLSA